MRHEVLVMIHHDHRNFTCVVWIDDSSLSDKAKFRQRAPRENLPIIARWELKYKACCDYDPFFVWWYMVFFSGREVNVSRFGGSASRYDGVGGASFELNNSCVLRPRSSSSYCIFLLLVIVDECRPN